MWEFSSAGRASALQAGGHRFEPYNSHHFIFKSNLIFNMREWLSGRASPCQGECREFESRLPLQNKTPERVFFLSMEGRDWRVVSFPTRQVQ